MAEKKNVKKETTKKNVEEVKEEKFFDKVKTKAKEAGQKVKDFGSKHKKGLIAGAVGVVLAGAGAVAAKKFLGGRVDDDEDYEDDEYDYDEAEDSVEDFIPDFAPDVDEEE